MSAASPFDGLAPDYDEAFSTSELGTRMRRALWRHLDASFSPGQRVLDLGCGTGEDAVHLAGRGLSVVAIDSAERMADAARRKADRAGVSEAVTVMRAPIEELADAIPRIRDGGPIDGAYSSFGALNCVRDLARVSAALGRLLAPGATVLLCLMGRLAPWEWGYYAARGEFRKAFRRLPSGGVEWRGMRVFYPTIAAVKGAFGLEFEAHGAVAIGALLPPTYLERWARGHVPFVDSLDRWERRIEAMPLVPGLSDHFLLKLVRR